MFKQNNLSLHHKWLKYGFLAVLGHKKSIPEEYFCLIKLCFT
tara:strand:- start:3229 stop:3354 length:126 start_codon:yes stop_codon:yes gene_type:complete